MTSPLRTPGFWLAVPLAILQAVNAGRAFFDPAGFAAYFGAPLTGGAPTWVYVYGLRTAFIALAVAAMLVRRDLRALMWIALAAVVMPVGDAVIAHGAGAPLSIVGRHIGITVYLVVTAAALAFATRRSS